MHCEFENYVCTPGFLNHSTIDIWVWIIHCCRGHLIKHWRMFSTIPGLCLLDASSISYPPPRQPKTSPVIASEPWGSGQDHLLLRTTGVDWQKVCFVGNSNITNSVVISEVIFLKRWPTRSQVPNKHTEVFPLLNTMAAFLENSMCRSNLQNNASCLCVNDGHIMHSNN